MITHLDCGGAVFDPIGINLMQLGCILHMKINKIACMIRKKADAKEDRQPIQKQWSLFYLIATLCPR